MLGQAMLVKNRHVCAYAECVICPFHILIIAS